VPPALQARHGNQNINVERHEFVCHAHKALGPLVGEAMFDRHCAVVHVASIAQASHKRPEVGRIFLGASGMPERTSF